MIIIIIVRRNCLEFLKSIKVFLETNLINLIIMEIKKSCKRDLETIIGLKIQNKTNYKLVISQKKHH